MNTIFEMAGTAVHNKILVTSNFHKRRCGTIDIYNFDILILDPQDKKRVHFNVNGGKYWSGGQEPIGYKYPDLQPYNRSGQMTYIPHGFDRLDIIPTAWGGRFLSLNKAWPTCSTSTSADQYPEREEAVIVSDQKELKRYLLSLLWKMGVPLWNIFKVRKDIVSKLF